MLCTCITINLITDQHVLYEQRAVHDNTVMVGSIVAVLDAEDDANHHIASQDDQNQPDANPTELYGYAIYTASQLCVAVHVSRET